MMAAALRDRLLRSSTYVLVVVLSGFCGHALAQSSWPTKPIRVVVPAPPGGLTDVIARTVGDRLTQDLGQPLVIENQAGAAGTTGTGAVAKAVPDGHTLLVHSSSFTVTAAAFTNLPYDAVKDFSAVIPLGSTPSVLVVSSKKGYRTVHDLVAAAKASQHPMSYAGGLGSAGHLTAERFRLSAGFEALHIPYRGAPQALPDVVSGRVDFYFSPLLPALSLIQDGQLVALAVSTSKRVPTLQDVPTIAETGFRHVEYEFWNGMFVPARTPRDVIDRLYTTTSNVLRISAIQEKLAVLGNIPMNMSSSEFEKHVKDEIVANRILVKATGMKLD